MRYIFDLKYLPNRKVYCFGSFTQAATRLRVLTKAGWKVTILVSFIFMFDLKAVSTCVYFVFTTLSKPIAGPYGERGGTRTLARMIKSHVRYQLRYTLIKSYFAH